MATLGKLSLDGFEHVELTAAINRAPFMKGAISRSGLFHEQPVQTTEVAIERIAFNLTLVAASPRGGIGDIHPVSARDLVKFKAPHLRTRSTMLAASWQDKRGFGSAGLADVMKERDRVLAEHRQRLELTIERHTASALNGLVLDADGSVLVDLFAGFDVAQNVHAFATGNAASDMVSKVMEAKRKAEAELDVPVPRWVGFGSPAFMDALRTHPSTGKIFANWAAADDLRQDKREGFSIGGVVWSEVGPVAGVDFIPAGVGFLCPVVSNLYESYFAPADYMDTVNSEALPLYSRAHELPFNRGVQLESQSNPISLVTRPRAVIRCEA